MGLIYSQNNVLNLNNQMNQPLQNQPNQNNTQLLNETNQNQSNEIEEKINTINPSNLSKKEFIHKIISLIFKISLNPQTDIDELYLELYHAQLLSNEKEEIFEIDQIDDIIYRYPVTSVKYLHYNIIDLIYFEDFFFFI